MHICGKFQMYSHSNRCQIQQIFKEYFGSDKMFKKRFPYQPWDLGIFDLQSGFQH